MISIRRSHERGRARLGWLDTRYSFSFADYHDPRFMGFRALRVLNEDRVAPGKGFPEHGHRDMEILTWVLSGELEHGDSLGNGSRIRPGELQRMTAGSGVTHSEFNPSPVEPLHLLQIWILPERSGLEPGYEQRAFPAAELEGALRPIASRDGREGSLRVHQDVVVYAARLRAGAPLAHELAPGRHAWVQVAAGAVELDGLRLGAGDGAAASGERALRLVGLEDAELLVFDLA
jgi:redox-sensitive bicupin YhaK (pirin superfamily)